MQPVIFYSLLAGTATLIGSLAPLRRAGWQPGPLRRMMAFGAGVLLGAALVHLIPEAVVRGSGPASWGLVASFGALFALEQVTFTHACPEYCEECPLHPMGLVAFAALTLHSLVDGLAVAAGFGASTSLGLVAAFAVIVHEFPEGLSMAAIALGAGYGRRQAFLLSLVVALATPLGAIVAYRGIQGPGDPLLALLLGVSAGSFLYVAATDLLPQLHREQDWSVFVLFVVGLGLMILSKAYPLG